MFQKRHYAVIFVFLASNVCLVWTTLCYCTSRDNLIPVFPETKTLEKISTKFLKNKCFIGQTKGALFCPEDLPFCFPLEGIRQTPCSQALQTASYSWQLSSSYPKEQTKHNSADDTTDQNPKEQTKHNSADDTTDQNPKEQTKHNSADDTTDQNPKEQTKHNSADDTTDQNPKEQTKHNSADDTTDQRRFLLQDDPSWSEWGSWQECIALSCGTSGIQSRARHCLPKSTTGNCVGENTEFSTCIKICSQLNGSVSTGWSEWSAWSACTVPCNSSDTSIRTRGCQAAENAYCIGHAKEEKPCPGCAVDGSWAMWTAWTKCSVTCENGTRSRRRTCSNPRPHYGGLDCVGQPMQTEICVLNTACVVDGGWSVWSAWFGCSATCGEGIDHRYRACNNPLPTNGGIYCHGPFSETSSCNLGHCPVDGDWSEWGSWGACSVTCSNGTSVRSRTCSNPAPMYGGKICIGMSTDNQNCIQAACKIDGGWAEWSPWFGCSVTCDQGIDHRYRACTNPTPQHGGNYCKGSFSETSKCELVPCPVDGSWAEWGPWGSCSVTCSNGTSERTRTCANPMPAFGGKSCVGDSKDMRDCLMKTCVVDGNWAEWGAWGSCSVTCSNGTSVRNRTCDNPAPQNGGKQCPGHSTDVMGCLQNPCPIDGNWGHWTPWSRCIGGCNAANKQRYRNCDNPLPENGGNICEGTPFEMTPCIPQSCATTVQG